MYNGLLEEVCEGSIGEGGLRFKVQKIQGMPLYAFPIFQKSCSWRRFETDLKLGYRDFIQFGGFGNLYQFGFDWNFWAHLIQRFQVRKLLKFRFLLNSGISCPEKLGFPGFSDLMAFVSVLKVSNGVIQFKVFNL
ncbi:hypothetical protein DVH24_022640 [Malus domestica]|uniref:Uncharacterized protein n=1 Tax=Malus domestica TaxID=3750 RepID=A0A498KLZ2_MALDO|nr:hypothetical protein DVH24_022640 [Malus domestica]